MTSSHFNHNLKIKQPGAAIFSRWNKGAVKNHATQKNERRNANEYRSDAGNSTFLQIH